MEEEKIEERNSVRNKKETLRRVIRYYALLDYYLDLLSIEIEEITKDKEFFSREYKNEAEGEFCALIMTKKTLFYKAGRHQEELER